MRRALRLLASTAVCITAGAFVLSLLVPRLLGWDVRTVLSASMQPKLPVGALIAVKPVDPDSVRAGDVITFTDDGRFVTHRVVEVRRDGAEAGFVTKGDANEDPDPAVVPAAAVTGRLAFVIPGLGRLVTTLRTPRGFTMFVLGPAFALVLAELARLWRSSRPVTPLAEGN